MARTILGLMLAGLLAACATTDDLIVNTEQDAADASPGDGVCAIADAPGLCSLRAAVEEANARPLGSSSRILIMNPGTYVLEAGDGTGRGLVIGPGSRFITIQGCCLNPEATTITRADGVLQRIVTIEGGGVVLRNLRLANGRTPGGPIDAEPEKDGGAVMLRGAGARLSLERVIVEDSEASRQGGGIYAADAGDTVLTVANSVIRRNAASNAGIGGAGGIHSGARTFITSTLFEANRGNSGGLRLQRAARAGEPAHEVLRSTFRDNITSNNGGGMRIDTDDGRTIVAFSTFSRNQSEGPGGSGLGIHLLRGELALHNATLSENGDPTRPIALLLGAGTTAVLRSTIVAQNGSSGSDEREVYCSASASLVLDGFNLLDVVDGCTAIDPDPASPDETGPVDADLGFYVTDPIGHYPLNPGSPALDGGLFICGGTDQIGTSRPQDGNGDGVARCDIGAIEQVQR